MPKTTIYKPNGEILIREWAEDEKPSLEWLQAAVEGYIQWIPGSWTKDGLVEVYANEEAFLLNLPPNEKASKDLDLSETATYDGLFRGNVVKLEGFNEKLGTPITPTIIDIESKNTLFDFGSSAREQMLKMLYDVALEVRWRDREKKLIYTWDELHGELEVFNQRGRHIGAVDPVTGTFTKDGVKGRKIDV